MLNWHRIHRAMKELLFGWTAQHQHERHLREDLGDPKDLIGMRVRFTGWSDPEAEASVARNFGPLYAGTCGDITGTSYMGDDLAVLVRWDGCLWPELLHPLEEVKPVLVYPVVRASDGR